MIATAMGRAALRRSTRVTLIASGPAVALVDLQVWAKPHRLSASLAGVGLDDMTCESVMVEMRDRFPPGLVDRAQRFLAEHRRDR